MKFLITNTLATCILFTSLQGNEYAATPTSRAERIRCRKAKANQPTPDEITKAVAAMASTEGYKGTQSLHDILQKFLATHPYPAPQPYDPWKAYAQNLQTELAKDRSASEQAASTQITNDITAYITQNKLDSGATWSIINQMKPSVSDINDGIFSAYATNIQNSLLSPIWSGKPGVLPDAPSPPPPPDIRPADETVLKINGVSYVLIPDPSAKDDPTKSMAFPISHTSDAGGAAEPDCTSTEAIWYTLQIAYNAKDQTLFHQILNGYWYLTQQKLATIKAIPVGPDHDDHSWALTNGETGWIVKLGIPPSSFNVLSNNFPYPQGNAGDPNLSTATDADEHIIEYMIKGQNLFGDLVLHCFGNFPGGLGYQGDRHISTVVADAVKTFLLFNVSGTPSSQYDKAHIGFKYDGHTYNPVLSNDNWGGGQWAGTDLPNEGTFLNPSYFDPHTLTIIYNYILSSKDPAISSRAPQFKTAITNSVAYLKDLQSKYQDKSDPAIAGMPDNPAWNEGQSGPHPVGWDSIRFLTNAGKYIDDCENKGLPDLFGILADMKDMGTKMLKYVIKYSDQSTLYTPEMILDNTPNGAKLNGGALLGPLLVAMKALDPTNPNIAKVSASLDGVLKINMALLNPSRSDAYSHWQDDYYGTVLALTNRYDADHIGKGE